MTTSRTLGPLTAYHPPTIDALRAYSVNREGQAEVIWSPLYDFQAYPAAGAALFTFFQNPVGSAAAPNLTATNMQAPGQLPRPQEFLVTGIQVYFRPGSVPGREVAGAAVLPQNINDVNAVMFGATPGAAAGAGAFLEFYVGSKVYLDDAPIGKFSQQFKIGGLQAITGTPAAAAIQGTDYAVHCGRYYAITPVKLTANQNFRVTINYPVAVATPSTVAGRIGVILDGFLYRLSQ
jgi:hypothetical protein